MQAAQLDTSPGLCAGLNAVNCSISAEWFISQMPQAFQQLCLPISGHMKIESFGTQAEGEDWEANRAGYSLPLPFGMINLQRERTPESFSWQDSPLALSGSPCEERPMNASFFPFFQVQPYSHLRLTTHNRTVSACLLPELRVLFYPGISRLFTSQWQGQSNWSYMKA